MAEPGEGHDLAVLAACVRCRHAGQENLDGDRVAQHLIVRLEDFCRATAAEQGAQQVPIRY